MCLVFRRPKKGATRESLRDQTAYDSNVVAVIRGTLVNSLR